MLIRFIGISEPELRKFAANIGTLLVRGLPVDQLVEDLPLKREVVKDLRIHGINSGLVGFELLSGLVMVSEQWGKKLRLWDGAVDREKVIARYSQAVQVIYLDPHRPLL